LSENSIHSRWVNKELSVAVVQQIDGIVKRIIPVVLDGVQVPDVLKDTVWQVVDDPSNLDLLVSRIVAALLGQNPPPLGPKPAYAGVPVHRLGGLIQVDEIIFRLACEELISRPNWYPIVDFQSLATKAADLDVSAEQFYESVAVLENEHFFRDVGHYLGQPTPSNARISGWAFEQFLVAYRPVEYRNEKAAVIATFVNHNAHSSRVIAQQYQIHEYIVDHILEELHAAGHIPHISYTSDGAHFMAGPTLRRALSELENDSRRWRKADDGPQA
jgi:hypothetical protein